LKGEHKIADHTMRSDADKTEKRARCGVQQFPAHANDKYPSFHNGDKRGEDEPVWYESNWAVRGEQ
jgi:hypothetical protein